MLRCSLQFRVFAHLSHQRRRVPLQTPVSTASSALTLRHPPSPLSSSLLPSRGFSSDPGQRRDFQDAEEMHFREQVPTRDDGRRPSSPRTSTSRPQALDPRSILDQHPALRDDHVNRILAETAEERRREKMGDLRRARLRNLGEVKKRERELREQQILQHNLRQAAEAAKTQSVEEALFGEDAPVFDPKFAKPIRPEPTRTRIEKRDPSSKSRAEHRSKQSPGPIVDKEGRMLEPRNWLQSIRRTTDQQEFKQLVRLARLCNWTAEGNLMGSALLHALKSRFRFGIVDFILRGKRLPSDIVLTNACSLAVEYGYGEDMLELLVRKGAVLDGPTDSHPLPLHQALLSRRQDICDWFMKRGVRTDLQCPITLRSTVEVALMSDMGEFLERYQLEVPERVVHSRSILWALVKRNAASSVKLLMDKGADVTRANELGEVPMVLAASLDHWDVIRVLTEGGVSIFDPLPGEGKKQSGTDADQEDDDVQQNYSPARKIDPQPRYSSAFATAVRLGHHRTVRGLLRLGADLNARHPITGITPLMEAVENGEVELVDQLLSMGADAYVWDSDHRNAMSIAVTEDQFQVLQCLLKHRLDLNTADPVYAVTPLMLAALHNRQNMVQLLLEHQADLHRVSKNGQTAMGTVLRTKRLNLVRVLVESGADVDTRDENGCTVLYHAIERGDSELLEFILEHQPSLQISVLEPELDPLALAVRVRQQDAVDILVRAGYLEPQPVPVEDDEDSGHREEEGEEEEEEEEGKTTPGQVVWKKTWALAEASRLQDLRMCANLMRSGADPLTPDPEGNTALHYAVQHETPNVEFLRALFRRGGNPFARNAEGHSPWHLCPDPKLRDKLVEWNMDRPEAMQAMLPDELL